MVPIDSTDTGRRDPAMSTHEDLIHDAILATASDNPETAERAAAYLLDRPQQSQPALLKAMQDMEGNPAWVADLLGKIGHPESVPLLQNKLAVGVHNLRFAAAMALAEHPHATAFDALISSLDSEIAKVCGMAAVGLGRRGDKAACPALLPHLRHPDVNARHPVIEAMWYLGCLNPEDLATIRAGDTNPLVRELIDGLLASQEDSSP